MSTKRSLVLHFGIVLIFGLASLLAPGSAAASAERADRAAVATGPHAKTSASVCDGKGEGHKARWYDRLIATPPSGVVRPVGGFDTSRRATAGTLGFEDIIQITVGSPTRTEPQGASTKFEFDVTNCPKLYVFRVIVDYNLRNDGDPRGIIRAYQIFL